MGSGGVIFLLWSSRDCEKSLLGVVAGDVEFWNTLERGERSEFWGMLSILDMWGLLGAALDTLGEMGDGVVSSVIGSWGR